MENVFKYYDFSKFFTVTSEKFSGNEICFTELNSNHFLIFEKIKDSYKLYITKYNSVKDIGFKEPEIAEVLVEKYDKTNHEHRKMIKQYIY